MLRLVSPCGEYDQCFLWLLTIAGCPDFGSSSRFSLSLLNSTVHFCTVDKAGVSSPNVATMSTWISLGAEPCLCRYLITPQCQIWTKFSIVVTFEVFFEQLDVSYWERNNVFIKKSWNWCMQDFAVLASLLHSQLCTFQSTILVRLVLFRYNNLQRN